MTKKTSLSVVLMCGIVGLQGGSFAQELRSDHVKQSTHSDLPNAIKLFHEVPFRAYPYLIPPISPDDVNHYCRLLRLSDEQCKFLSEALYPVYLNETKEVTLGPLMTVSEISMRPRPLERHGLEALETFRELASSRKDVALLYHNKEQQFFEQIKVILSTEQLSRVERVIWHRKRSWSNVYKSFLRGSRIDLATYVNNLPISSEAWDDVDSVLWEYERELTPIMERMGQILSNQRVPYRQLFIEYAMDVERAKSTQEPTVREVPRDSFRQATVDLLAEGVNAQLKVRDVNAKWFPKIEAALPPALQGRFRKQYREFAWSHLVYPDKTNSLHIADAILNSESLNEDTRLAITEAATSFQSKYDRVCRRLEAKFEQLQEFHARTYLWPKAGTPIREEFRALWIDRWGFNRDFVIKLKGILPPDVFVEFSDEIEKYLERHKAVGESTLTPYFPEPVI